jgi:hypothetical protein
LEPAKVSGGDRKTQKTIASQPAPELDEELRNAVLSVFKWCDADEDGILNGAEYAAAQRLIAELCPADFDEAAARSIFEKANDSGTSSLVDEDAFLQAMQLMVDALSIPRRQLLDGLRRQTSKRSSRFDRTVNEFQQALVRNVSNLPESNAVGAPPPLQLWRTETGGNTFSLPPGTAPGPPAAIIAFKLMQYLGMKTEDSSFIDGELAAKMMGHRQNVQGHTQHVWRCQGCAHELRSRQQTAHCRSVPCNINECRVDVPYPGGWHAAADRHIVQAGWHGRF